MSMVGEGDEGFLTSTGKKDIWGQKQPAEGQYENKTESIFDGR